MPIYVISRTAYLKLVPLRRPVPNWFVGENSHFNVTFWNDYFALENRQAFLALPFMKNSNSKISDYLLQYIELSEFGLYLPVESFRNGRFSCSNEQPQPRKRSFCAVTHQIPAPPLVRKSGCAPAVAGSASRLP